MEDIRKVLNEYADLAMKAHKIEDQMLDMPKAAAERSQLDLDLLLVADSRDELFGNSFLAKYKQLREVERKRDQARSKFMRLLAH